MAKDKALFNVGVFMIPAKLVDGNVKLGLNVRRDQEYQRKTANLPEDSPILLVDCKGGAVKPGDTSLEVALVREVEEETKGCRIEITGENRQPKELMKDPAKNYDLAFWRPARLWGNPRPSDEALDHVWLSLEELKSGEKYRPVSGLGLAGRTGQMITEAAAFYEANKSKTELFS